MLRCIMNNCLAQANSDIDVVISLTLSEQNCVLMCSMAGLASPLTGALISDGKIKQEYRWSEAVSRIEQLFSIFFCFFSQLITMETKKGIQHLL